MAWAMDIQPPYSLEWEKLLVPALALIGVMSLKIFYRGYSSKSRKRDDLVDLSNISPYPYECCSSLLTAAELRFANGLRISLESRFSLSFQTRLEDIIHVRNDTDPKLRFSCRNRIKSRHVDLVVYDPVDSEIIAAIELDDSSHLRKDRQERDCFMNELFESCGLPLIRIPVCLEYDFEDIAKRIHNLSAEGKYDNREVVTN